MVIIKLCFHYAKTNFDRPKHFYYIHYPPEVSSMK